MNKISCIRRSITSLVLVGIMAVQSILPAYAAADEIHLINDLGSGGKGNELTLEEEADRNWGEDLVSVAKGSWYDAHSNDEDAGMRKATPASLATSSDLANAFEDFDEVKAQKDVEKLLKKADKEVISQSGTWLSHMLKEAVIPKEAVPRESVLKTEILELYKLNGDDYTVFHTEENWIPQVGDVVFFAKTVEKKATGSNIVATFSDLPEELTEDLRLKRRAAKAVIGGVIIDAPDQNSERDKYITFLYCSEKDKVKIGYMPLKKAEIIGIASIQTLHDKYCGILEDAEEEPEHEEQVVEEEVIKNYPAFAHEQTIWGYRIALAADEGVFPEGTAVSIKPVTSIDGQNIEELLKKQRNKETITKVMSFDITFTCDGQEIQPEDGTVSVSIHLASDMLKEKRKSDKNEVVVYHIPDADTVDEVASHLNEKNEVEYEAEKFSVYSVAVKMAATGDVVASGYCGKNGGTNLTWTITGEWGDYTLTISGEGEMEDYGYYSEDSSAPWMYYSKGFEKLVLEKGVTSIGAHAFEHCYIGGTLDIPSWVKDIGDSAFSNCSFKGNLILSSSGMRIGEYAFFGCNNGFDGDIEIASATIEKYAFSKCKEFKNLIIHSGEIGDYAFYDCSALTNIKLYSGVKIIGDYAFDGCISLSGDLSVPASVARIGKRAFQKCYKSNEPGILTINAGIIDEYAFLDCTGFAKLEIGSGTTHIGDWAFGDCSGLKGSLILPAEVKSIGIGAFWGCSGFDGVLRLPSGINSIGNNAFKGCSGLTGDLILPSRITTIGEGAFRNCSGLTGNLILPPGITSIGEAAFYNCSGLTGDLVLPAGITSISRDVFYGCSGLNGNLIIPSGIENIGDFAFCGCTGITGVSVIPDSVKDIGKYAFDDFGTEKIIVFQGSAPSHYLESYTYEISTDVMTIYYPRADETWSSFFPYNIDKNATLIPYLPGTEPWNWNITFSEGTPSMYCIFTASEELKFTDQYNVTDFDLSLSPVCIPTTSSDNPVYQDLTMTVELPDGLSFSKDNPVDTVRTESLGDMSVDGMSRKDVSLHVYIEPTYVTDMFTVKITLSTPSVENPRLQDGLIKVDLTGIPKIENEGIMEAVDRYANGEEAAEIERIWNSSDSREDKIRKTFEFYNYDNLLDVKDRIETLKATHDERWDFNGLVRDEMYLSWQYWDYLNNQPEGIKTRVALVLSGLAFNNELGTWLDPSTYIESDYPGVSKYYSMLEDFIDKQKDSIEYYSYLKKTHKFINDSVGLWTEVEKGEAIKQLEQSLDTESLQATFEYIVNNKVNGLEGKPFSLKSDEKTPLMEGLGIVGTVFHMTNVTVDSITDFVMIDSNLETYYTFHRFLEEIYTANDLPIELTTAALKLDREMKYAYLTPVMNILNEIKNTCLDKALDMSGMSDIIDNNGYLAAIKYTSFVINQFVNVGDMVVNSAQTEGYVFLANHYKNKLLNARRKYLSNRNEENAWEFYEAYVMLWKLRLSGEEKYLEMNKLEGGKTVDNLSQYMTGSETGTLGDVISNAFGYEDKKAAVEDSIEMVKGFEFQYDAKDIPEEMKYLQKVTVECPVDVRIALLDGTEVFNIPDKTEMRKKQNDWQFISFYRATTGDYVKIVYYNYFDPFKILATGTEEGYVSVTLASKLSGELETKRFIQEPVVEGSSYLCQSDDAFYQVDYNADGIYEASYPYDSSQELKGTIHFVNRISKAEKTVQLDGNTKGIHLKDNIDIEELEASIGKYVFAVIDSDNNMQSFEQVETAIGDVRKEDTYSDEVDIDDTSYRLCTKTTLKLGGWTGYTVLYHYSGSYLYGMQLLEERNADVDAWDPQNLVLTTGGLKYQLTEFSDIGLDEILPTKVGHHITFLSVPMNGVQSHDTIDGYLPIYRVLDKYVTKTGEFKEEVDLFTVNIDDNQYLIDRSVFGQSVSDFIGRRVYYVLNSTTEKIVDIGLLPYQDTLNYINASVKCNNKSFVLSNNYLQNNEVKVELSLTYKDWEDFNYGRYAEKSVILADIGFDDIPEPAPIEISKICFDLNPVFESDFLQEDFLLKQGETWSKEATIRLADYSAIEQLEKDKEHGTSNYFTFSCNGKPYKRVFYLYMINTDNITDEIELKLDMEDLSLIEGNSHTLVAALVPVDLGIMSLNWKSSDPSVATVTSEGIVKAVHNGVATITVTTADGKKKASCLVSVKPADVFVTGISLNKSDLSLTAGLSQKLGATISPTNASNKSITWKSSNTAVATVSSDGMVKAIKPGTATITVTTVDGKKTASCTVTVKAATVAVSGVTLNKASITLDTGKAEKLTATVSPTNATNKSITWQSNNIAIATVASDGTVKAVKPGKATITVTTADGRKTASCTVTVNVLKNGWYRENGKDFWFENGVKQGTTGRGKEIYDPGSNAWYWLDAVQGGAKAVNKEVYMDYADKWVRYDANGHMVKGWYSNSNGTYYYNLITGAMTKGETTIDNIPCYFNSTTGVGHDGWRTYSGKNYWYEHGARQGTKYDKNGVRGDGTIRGREIFDPGTNAWYWLDAVYDGAKAENKEVWMPYIFQNENPKTGGKWVRYNSTGGMIKGWYTEGNRKYYYDPTTGAMVKGTRVIDGKTYHFDSVTGVLK